MNKRPLLPAGVPQRDSIHELPACLLRGVDGKRDGVMSTILPAPRDAANLLCSGEGRGKFFGAERPSTHHSVGVHSVPPFFRVPHQRGDKPKRCWRVLGGASLQCPREADGGAVAPNTSCSGRSPSQPLGRGGGDANDLGAVQEGRHSASENDFALPLFRSPQTARPPQALASALCPAALHPSDVLRARHPEAISNAELLGEAHPREMWRTDSAGSRLKHSGGGRHKGELRSVERQTASPSDGRLQRLVAATQGPRSRPTSGLSGAKTDVVDVDGHDQTGDGEAQLHNLGVHERPEFRHGESAARDYAPQPSKRRGREGHSVGDPPLPAIGPQRHPE